MEMADAVGTTMHLIIHTKQAAVMITAIRMIIMRVAGTAIPISLIVDTITHMIMLIKKAAVGITTITAIHMIMFMQSAMITTIMVTGFWKKAVGREGSWPS